MLGPDTLQVALLYVPLGVIGLWRWSFWLVRRIGAAAYRPKTQPWPEDEPRPMVSVVTPVYNEDQELFDEAVRSWQRNGVDEIVAVIDKSNVRHIMRCQRDYVNDPTTSTQFRMIITPKPGKRAALCDGIEMATGDLIALVDSDTIWDENVTEKVVPFFAKPTMGGVTVAQRISNPHSIGNVLFDILLWTRYREEVPFLLGVGKVFNTLSGRTAFYRREALLSPEHKNMHDLRHEFFLGGRAVSGDDKRLSHLVIRQGWETGYARGTTVYTPGLGTLKNFFKQRLRWTRNSWRADLRAVAQGWVWRHPGLALFMIDRFVMPFVMLIGPVVFTMALINHDYVFAGILGLWWLASRFIRIFGYFKLHPSKILYLPLYTLYGYINAALKIYAFATLMENTWATRWSAKRAARKGSFRKSSTVIQGYFALAACVFLLTQIALSFRAQVGADIEPQPKYSMASLEAGVNKYRGYKSAPPVPLDRMKQTDIGTYIVQPGDTGFTIVAKLNTDRATLKQINSIGDLDAVAPGQKLLYFKDGS